MNQKIRNATQCNLGNITFKSQLEKMVYNHLLECGLNPQYEPKQFTLWDGFNPVTPFYDKETDTQKERRIKDGDYNKNKMLTKKEAYVIGIRYTPDFYFKYNDLDVYIETKGISNDVFYIKKKMFRKLLDDIYNNTGQKSIYFEVYTKKQLIQAIDIVKNYESTT
jgi:hypothetical protein